jgi:hypothetical protein
MSRRTIGIVATVLVAALVVAGLYAAGSPATARKFRIDRDRAERLGQLHSILVAQVQENGTLPASLGDLSGRPGAYGAPGFDPLRDPETGKLFEYRKVSGRQYEVCASFDTSSSDRRAGSPISFGPEGALAFRPGRNCFKRNISQAELGLPVKGVPIPVPAVPADPPPSPAG